MKKKLIVFLTILLSVYSFAKTPKNSFDICIYGESAAGVMASVQAAKKGKKVVLISKNNHVGGMATSGLTATDMSGPTLVGGEAKNFYNRLYEYYLQPTAWKNQNIEEFMVLTKNDSWGGKNDRLKMQWAYESSVGEKIMREMLKEANVNLIQNKQINLKSGVKKIDNKIVSIKMTDGTKIFAKVFIDASYEGDLLATSGVSYTIGRESNKQYGETLNGIRFGSNQKLYPVDPYIIEGDSTSGLLPFVEAKKLGEDGEADHRTQAYCFRVALTNDPNNQTPITKPKDYNPLWYEFTARRLKANPELPLHKAITISPMPNKKTDTNHLDFIGASYEYADADYKKRKKIEKMHRDYALGLLWFLGNDPRLPGHIRTDMKKWGLAKDEFVDNGNFPHQIYLREGRRMVGEYVMTENNLKRNDRIVAENPVAFGSYSFDCHEVARVVFNGKIKTDGDTYISTSAYPISYYSLVPKKNECANLLVPVCLSASHVAYGSIRMEPVYMVLGQAAALAATIAIDRNTAVQDIDYNQLKDLLQKTGHVTKLGR